MLSPALLLVYSLFIHILQIPSTFSHKSLVTLHNAFLPILNVYLLVTQYLLRALGANVIFLEALEVLLAEVLVGGNMRIHILRDRMCRVEGGRRICLCRHLPYRDELW